jgi:Plasmid encoded RepA protein
MSKKPGLTHVADILTPKLLQQIKRGNAPTPVQQRIIDAAAVLIENPDEPRSILYQHSAFCQVFFPYRDPGPEVLEWKRSNGLIKLLLEPGKAAHPDPKSEAEEWVQVPLPFGPKCRLVLMHINQIAILKETAHIEMDDSLTAFVRRVLKLDPNGRNMRMVKDQLRRLATSSIRLALPASDRSKADQLNAHIVTRFDVWFPKNENQRVLWPTYVDLSLDYLASLLEHAVPLDENHMAALSHSAMALDAYAWLAQRLHRVPQAKPVFLPWPILHLQFGQGYTGERGLRKFRQDFRTALKQVLAVYKAAKITEDERRRPSLFIQGRNRVWREPPAKGLTLYNSPPPVPPRLITAS